MKPIIKVENLSKQYRLGTIGTGTLRHDISRWVHRIKGKEDPFLKIGETNDRSSKGKSDYVWALKDINFEVMPGDVLGIIGKNGSGKSTLLKILSNVTGPTTGRIDYNGRIASLLEVGTGFHPELTGRENIFLNGAILGMTKHEIRTKLDEIIDFSGCERYIDTPVKRYSSGMMVRLGFAVAAHLDPEILVVDEVLAVGDAEFQKKAIGKMQDVSKSEGRTVLFVSHNLQSILKLCNRGIILKNGQIEMISEIDKCLDHYIKENNFGIRTKVTTTSKFRRGKTSMALEFVEVAINNNNPGGIATDEPLSILFSIKINNRNTEIFTIGVHIYDQNETSILTFISDVYDVPKVDSDIFKMHLLLSNHNLTMGRYNVHFTIGINKIAIGVEDYDVISDVLSFEIQYLDSETKQPYLFWPSQYWGNVLLKDSNLQFI